MHKNYKKKLKDKDFLTLNHNDNKDMEQLVRDIPIALYLSEQKV